MGDLGSTESVLSTDNLKKPNGLNQRHQKFVEPLSYVIEGPGSFV